MTNVDSDILSVVRSQFHSAPPSEIGVAVSGGGDSMALLHILTRCFSPNAVKIHAVTIDHGLRPETATEIEAVARLCTDLNVTHTVLRWSGWDGRGNLQAAARDARYRLFGEWARARKIGQIALAHTADDQAETFLMRLSRSAGVDGLSGMPTRRIVHGVSILRPMLDLTRAQLRTYLQRNDIAWCEDPSNVDPRFDRVKARTILTELAPLGLDVRGVATVAGYMSEAREALDWYTFLTARDIAFVNGGDVVMDLRRFRTQPQEIARRLLYRAVMWVGRSEYPPRRGAMAEAIEALRFGRGATMGGCQILVDGTSIWVSREYNAVEPLKAHPGALWDDRWLLIGPVNGDSVEIRPLGRKGLGQLPNWRETGRPHAALMASPAVWDGEVLMAAPLAGMDNGWRAELQDSPEAFFAALLSN